MGSALQSIIGNTSGNALAADFLVEVGDYRWGIAGANTTNGYYEPRIKTISEIRRIADPLNKKFDIGSVSIKLDNNDPKGQLNYLAPDALAGNIKEQECTIKLLIEAATITIYTGIVSTIKGAGDSITLVVRSKLFTDLGTIQRMVSAQRFPDAQERYIGVGIPLTLGDYEIAKAEEWIELPIISSALRYLAVSQVVPQGTLTTFDVYYLPEAGGGDPVLVEAAASGTAVFDDYGDQYLRYQVAPGSWDSSRKYVTPKLPPKTGSSISQILDDLQSIIIGFSVSLTQADLDSDKWGEVEFILNEYYGSAAVPYAGMPIPERGAPNIEAKDKLTEGWGIIQLLASILGISLYITTEGKIAPLLITPFELTDFDTSNPISTAASVYKFSSQDDTILRPTFNTSKWGIVTDLRASSSRPVTSGPAGTTVSERYQNPDVLAIINRNLIEETVRKGINLYGERVGIGRTSGRVNALWNLYLRSGAYTEYIFESRGLEGLIPDIGDRITFDYTPYGLVDAEMLVIGTSYMANTFSARLTCINVAEPTGKDNIVITQASAGQTTTPFTATVDTWVGTANPNTSHGTETTLQGAFNIGGIGGDAKRPIMRFNPLSVLDNTRTVVSGSLKVQGLGGSNDRSGAWVEGNIRQVTDLTWGDSSTWNNFTANGAGAPWVEKGAGVLVGPIYGTTPDMRPVGEREIVLNSTALAAINAILQAATGTFDIVMIIAILYPDSRSDADTNEICSMQSNNTGSPPVLELTHI